MLQVQIDDYHETADEQLSHQCLQAWVQCLTCEDPSTQHATMLSALDVKQVLIS